jgi:acetyl-CoA C-acetyltransferase
MNKSAFITTILRTPVGKYGGALASVRPDDLLACVLSEVVKANPSIDVFQIEEVIAGAANQSGEDNRNVARMAALLAGLPETVAGITVNRLCASGLQAIMDCARGIVLNQGNLYLAGGVESMSRAPFVMAKTDEPFSRKTEFYDTTIGWRFTNPELARKHQPYSMGETAENVASKWKITREAQDRLGLLSQQKYFQAASQNKFKEELVSVSVRKGKEITIVSRDEYPRETSLEKLAVLKPAFREGGTVTAGNSSGINDGAAAALIASEDAIRSFGLKPLVRIVSMASAGVDPAYMGIGPVPAVKKALQRAGLSIKDIGLFELNEAFASQVLACIQELDVDPSLVNVNGGSIAIGHPLGCSGVRISATLIHEMQKRKIKYGVATMCVGVGQGVAVVYEKSE